MPKAVYLILIINLIISIDVNSQNMQAGNINPESTEEVFKSLMDKCDDMDIIMLIFDNYVSPFQFGLFMGSNKVYSILNKSFSLA